MKKLMLFLIVVITTCLYSTIINVPVDQLTIQEGIDEAVNADTVLVQPGTYFENINYWGKNITIASLLLTTQDTTYISQTIIDGNQSGCVVGIVNGETMDAILTGFTITNGNSSADGGGIVISNSSPTLSDNVITGNSTDLRGGGVYISGNSSPVFSNNIICENTAGTHSAGMTFTNCSGTSNSIVRDCQIVGNTASQNCGGLGIFDSNVDVVNCIISDNNSGGNGGGVYVLSNAYANIINCTINGNTAVDGGGIAFAGSDITMINSIVEGNIAALGNGVYFTQAVDVDISFCDFFNDEPNFGGSIPAGLGDITGFNLYSTPCDDFHNIYEDPLFVGTGDDLFVLQEDSPCIDAGIQDTTGLSLPLFDIIGNERIADGRGDGFAFIDMGPYELPTPDGITQNQIPVPDIQLSNYPNPFNPSTTISYQLSENSKVDLSVYNFKGQKVKQLVSDQLSAGQHLVVWNGKDDNGKLVSSGMYFYKMKTDNREETKKMILLK